jgi:carbamoyltransferase
MIILGLSGALNHDASAALLIDGEIVAAAEEERFIREKHAKNRMPLNAARFCLAFAGIDARDIDIVAYPYAPIGLGSPARWHYAKRHWYAPDRALDALLNGNRRYRRNRGRVLVMGTALGIDWSTTRFVPVEHHLAHASSSYHLSGFTERTAILGVDGKGEYATTFFGYGEGGRIHKIKELYDPDSISGVYGAMTEYLGFEMLDGEYKVMGMAPYGDAARHDLSRLFRRPVRGEVEVDTRYVNTWVCGAIVKTASATTSAGSWSIGWVRAARTSRSTSRSYITPLRCRNFSKTRVCTWSTRISGPSSPRQASSRSPAAAR